MSTKSVFLRHFSDLTWDFTPDVIENRSKHFIGDIRRRIDEMTCLSDDKINFQSVCVSLADIEAEMERERSIIEVYSIASPVGELRNKCLELSKTWSDFFIETSMRRDIYDLLIKVQSRETSLPHESARYLEKSLLFKRRNGLHLEADVREKLTALQNNISDLCKDFNKNIAAVDMRIGFEKLDLLGMPHEFFKSLEEKDGKYIVILTYPHVDNILKHCKIIKTRKIIEKAYNSRCIDENVKILEEILKLRDKRAKILGYKTHADFVTEIMMSKSASTVHNFLTIMFNKIKNASKTEMNRLLQLKKEECEEMGVEFDGKINPYDCSYYENMVLKKDIKIDHDLIKQYFPFDHVTKELFNIYQLLLGLKFEKIANPPVINPDVSLYAVFDKATLSLIGYFYMDLFPRPLKFSNAACYRIQAACHYKNKPHIGCTYMIANFSKPFPGRPFLLTHEDVRIYFHEFGHIMHQICSKTRYSIFHGTSVERDFVEAPSQLLENWCWEIDSLKKISSHYLSILLVLLAGEPLPDDLIMKIVNSRRANISIFYARQICLSMFDYIIHTNPEECMIKYLGIEPTPETNFAASFEHMCRGYDAQYYGYLWSKMYSYDMFFSRFKKEGIFSPVTGLSFRNLILLPGATKNGSEMLKQFIGRNPTMDPF